MVRVAALVALTVAYLVFYPQMPQETRTAASLAVVFLGFVVAATAKKKA